MWLTIKDIAEHTKIKTKTIYHLVSIGEIPHFRIGRLIRFKLDEVEAWMISKKAATPAPDLRLEKFGFQRYNNTGRKPGNFGGKEV
ncbi:MAG: helix-turn-helix domain-containing protein [Deltaproteobacteria bacterium]|nr:helix-turn-helix domain-containing protein [Deltaproteobacteria bacterium]